MGKVDKGTEKSLRIICLCKVHCKINLRDSWINYDQTFLGLGLGKCFPARESLVSDISTGDRKSLHLCLRCMVVGTVYWHGILPSLLGKEWS